MKQTRQIRERKNRAKLYFFVVLLLWSIGISLGIIFLFLKINELWGMLPLEPAFTMENQEKTLTEEEKELQRKCKELYEKEGDLLVLVNKKQEIPSNYKADLRKISNGRLEAAKVLYEDLKEMLATADVEGGHSYFLMSAYRSREYQQKLVEDDVKAFMRQYGLSYEKALQKTLEETNPPGHSEHETGLALDIVAAGYAVLDESQAEKTEIQWLQKNAWRFGFILRYPKDKEEITGISYEPWHLRYVGKEAAKFLYENGLTLEEFYEYLE